MSDCAKPVRASCVSRMPSRDVLPLPLLKKQELLQNCNRMFLCQLLHGLTRPFKPILGRVWADWLFASKLICTQLHSPSVDALTISLVLSILSVVFSSSCRFGMSSPAVEQWGLCLLTSACASFHFSLVTSGQTQFHIYRLMKVLAILLGN